MKVAIKWTLTRRFCGVEVALKAWHSVTDSSLHTSGLLSCHVRSWLTFITGSAYHSVLYEVLWGFLLTVY